MPIEAIPREVEVDDRQGAFCDSSGATQPCVRPAKRKFRIVKREHNIPVLGVCECCTAEFTADPETIGRPQDAHAHIQQQFIAHKCKRLDASKNAAWIALGTKTDEPLRTQRYTKGNAETKNLRDTLSPS
jgi:hypothetical protein